MTADAQPTNPSALADRSALERIGVRSRLKAPPPADPQIRWRSPSGSDIERSTDGGQTWTKTASNPPGPVVAIRVVDALNAAVTTSDGRTFSTTDGGATWVPVQEKPRGSVLRTVGQKPHFSKEPLMSARLGLAVLVVPSSRRGLG